MHSYAIFREHISNGCIFHLIFFFKGQSLSCMFLLAQLMARGLKPWTFRLSGPDGMGCGQQKDGVMVGMVCHFFGNLWGYVS